MTMIRNFKALRTLIRFCNVEQKADFDTPPERVSRPLRAHPQNLSGFVFPDGETHCESEVPESFRTRKAVARSPTL